MPYLTPFFLQIAKEKITSLPFDASKAEFKELATSHLSSYPPTVTYDVSRDASPADRRLSCKIEVSGVDTVNGKCPFFRLTSTRPSHRGGKKYNYIIILCILMLIVVITSYRMWFLMCILACCYHVL